ncbi:MAG: hypothetical protein R6V75_10215 [Bacteroidales bacterium]
MEGNQLIKKKIILAIILAATSLTGAWSQEMVLQLDVDSIPGSGNFGPNRRHFRHLFVEMGLAIPYPTTEGNLIKVPHSGSLALGYRYKLKVINPLAVILEGGLSKSSFRLTQFEGKSFPDSEIHDRQTLHLCRASAGLALRFRFGQKGDYLGNYLDLGAREVLLLGSRLVEIDPGNSESGDWYRKKRQVYSGLDYAQRWVPELFARIGLNRIAITAAYRMGPIFRETVPVDLPKITAGVEFALVRY